MRHEQNCAFLFSLLNTNIVAHNLFVPQEMTRAQATGRARELVQPGAKRQLRQSAAASFIALKKNKATTRKPLRLAFYLEDSL